MDTFLITQARDDGLWQPKDGGWSLQGSREKTSKGQSQDLNPGGTTSFSCSAWAHREPGPSELRLKPPANPPSTSQIPRGSCYISAAGRETYYQHRPLVAESRGRRQRSATPPKPMAAPSSLKSSSLKPAHSMCSFSTWAVWIDEPLFTSYLPPFTLGVLTSHFLPQASPSLVKRA